MSQTINITLNLCSKDCKDKTIEKKLKMYNENHNDIYDNNNISNKNQLELSLCNIKPDD